jgi:arginase family enzyme
MKFNSTQFKIANFNEYNDYAKAYDYIKNSNDFSINLGGRSQCWCNYTIQPELDKFQDDFLVIWIDVHADINTWAIFNSKNIYGIPRCSISLI